MNIMFITVVTELINHLNQVKVNYNLVDEQDQIRIELFLENDHDTKGDYIVITKKGVICMNLFYDLDFKTVFRYIEDHHFVKNPEKTKVHYINYKGIISAIPSIKETVCEKNDWYLDKLENDGFLVSNHNTAVGIFSEASDAIEFYLNEIKENN